MIKLCDEICDYHAVEVFHCTTDPEMAQGHSTLHHTEGWFYTSEASSEVYGPFSSRFEALMQLALALNEAPTDRGFVRDVDSPIVYPVSYQPIVKHPGHDWYSYVVLPNK